MDSKATLQVLNSDMDLDNNEWITINKCSDDNDDEGYKGIVFLNDDKTFQRMMGGGPNSTWPYRSFETVFDRFRLNWNTDVKMEQPENEQKQTTGESVMSFFEKTKEDLNKMTTSSEQTKPSEEKPLVEDKEPEEKDSDVKSQEEPKLETETKPTENTDKSNSFIEWLTGTNKSSSGLNNCKEVKIMKVEQGRHRVITIQQKERERQSR
jgi:hypothetical protein